MVIRFIKVSGVYSMGEENIEDRINDADYQNSIYSMGVMVDSLVDLDKMEAAKGMYASWKRVSDEYIIFRLNLFDSEARRVVKEVYKVLGYNPYNPRQIGGKNE